MAKDLSPSTHPLTPPLTEEEWHFWLRLLRSRRVGVSTFLQTDDRTRQRPRRACGIARAIAAEAGVKNYQPLPARNDQRMEWQTAMRCG